MGVETLHEGWNVLAGSDEEKILTAIRAPLPALPQQSLIPEGRRLKFEKFLVRVSENVLSSLISLLEIIAVFTLQEHSRYHFLFPHDHR
jgi:hypothetical protein